jgi:phosphotransacetylase/acyl dehydratase
VNAGPGSPYLETVPYAELRIGQTVSDTRTIGQDNIDLLSIASGDAECDACGTVAAPAGPRSIHGVWGTTLISALIDERLPGPGGVYRRQNLTFTGLIAIGDSITSTVRVASKSPAERMVRLDCRCVNQSGEEVISGWIEVEVPETKLRHLRRALPEVRINRHNGFQALIAKASQGPPVATAVVHPCDDTAIGAVDQAAQAGLIIPVLVGPEAKIRAAAAIRGVDLKNYRIVPAPHSHAAAAQAVALVRSGEAAMLMKGSLHTDELLHEVVNRATGLRTERRLSHVFLMDVPAYPRLLLLTDGAVNVAPDLAQKRDIVQNAIGLARVIGCAEPCVAILSAVETVNPVLQSTLDAAALCKMADRGQIVGGVLDGPLALDNAISSAAAEEKGIRSAVAGRADILLAPDLEAGNMLAKQLSFLSGADAAGIVLGAKVPIVLNSRADTERSRIASCAIGVLMARSLIEARSQPGPL